MTLEVTAWAPSREIIAPFLEAVGICSLDEATGEFVPIANVHIYPFRPNETLTVTRVTGTDPETGEDIVEIAEGFHINFWFYGSSAETLTAGLPQYDEEGNLLPLFERTHILDLVDQRTGVRPEWAETLPPLPPGYETPDGIRAFDPQLIKQRRNVLA